MLREFELPVFGGDVLVLLLGLWRELCDALEDVLEKCREVSGTDRCAGEVRKSEPGEVDNDGPSDLEHSDTFRLRQACGFEHSDDRRLLLVL